MAGVVLLTEDDQRKLATRRPPPGLVFAVRGYPRPSRLASGAASSSIQISTITNNSDTLGHRRSNVTITPTSRGKPSIGTANTSPRTNFTRSEMLSYGRDSADCTPGVERIHCDSSYAILRGDINSFSSNASDDPTSANRYAGTSSGLKISVTWIMVGVVAGVVLGLILGQVHMSADLAKWVSLPGDLFMRGLKCLAIPYVFCAVAVAVGDIVFVGKVSIIGFQTFRMFALLWVSSASIGMGVALVFRPVFARATNLTPPHIVGFTCSNGNLLTVSTNTRVQCVTKFSPNTTTLPASAAFMITDVTGTFGKASDSTKITHLSLTDQLIGIIQSLVSENLMKTLANGDLISTITFAMVFGAIAGRNYFTKTRRVNYLYLTMLQLRNTFFLAMEWIIWLSPFAVISIIAGSFAKNESALRQFTQVYAYVLAAFVAAALQMLVVFPFIVFLLTRCNPYTHMRKMLRAYIFAFASQSSLATAPITLTCVKKAKVCSQSLANFVISIGVCSNLSAVGWYTPITVTFLAESSGNGDELTFLRLVGVFVLSVLQCAGTAPIPSGVLVSIVSIYTALFGVASVPDTFVFVTAMDFIVDRFVTVCDVNDDIMCLKVIAENTDETVTQEHLGERE